MPGDMTDEARLVSLLEGVGAGDRVAFRALYEATAPTLFGVIRRLLRSREDAEVVLQEVYLAVWKKGGDICESAGSPMTWLISIARHRAIDLVRSNEARARRATRSLDLTECKLPHDASRALSVGQRQDLNRYLSALDDEMRAMLILAYCDGFSRDELSTRFKCPTETIKTRLRRGVVALMRRGEELA